MNGSVSWTPADDKAGRSVQAHVLASDGPLRLTGGDLWRWLMCQLVEAEYNLDAMAWMSGRPVPHPPFVDTKTVGDASSRREVAHALAGSWDPSPDLGRDGFFFLGDVPVWMWQAAQRRARTVLRAAHPVAAGPTFRSLEDMASPGPLWNPARLRSSVDGSQ